jgi:integral membrane sensor domain MASE1
MSMRRMVVVAIGIALLGLLGIVLFTELWYRLSLGAAIAVLVGVLLFIGWRKDQRDREAREELEALDA